MGVSVLAWVSMTSLKLRLSLSLLLFTPVATAHRFFWNPASVSYESAYALDNEPTSLFVVGELAPGEVDVYRVDAPVGMDTVFAVIAPQACPDFLPELWVVAKSLTDTEDAPFATPFGYKALRVEGRWQPYRDYILTARLGPNVRTALDESGYYLVVYAGEAAGYYIGIRGGRDAVGGTSEGFDALARFVRCG